MRLTGPDDIHHNEFTTDLAVSEDGCRMEESDHTFEWWYFDSVLDDGSTCVVSFLNKRPFITTPLAPMVQINISPPESSPVIASQTNYPVSQYERSPDHCKVRIGPSQVEGDLQTYQLHAEDAGTQVVVDLSYTTVVPGFRVGPRLSAQQMATMWLGEQVVIPLGSVEGTLTYNGSTHTVQGTGYHDHQWGGLTIPPPPPPAPQPPAYPLPTDWYWGRANAGDHALMFPRCWGRRARRAP
jgi:hypothetical protein